MTSNKNLFKVGHEISNEETKYGGVFLFLTEDDANQAVEDGTIGESDIYAYANERTENVMENLNLAIRVNELEDRLLDYNLEYPVTVDDLVNKPDSVYQLMGDSTFTTGQLNYIADYQPS